MGTTDGISSMTMTRNLDANRDVAKLFTIFIIALYLMK